MDNNYFSDLSNLLRNLNSGNKSSGVSRLERSRSQYCDLQKWQILCAKEMLSVSPGVVRDFCMHRPLGMYIRSSESCPRAQLDFIIDSIFLYL